MSQENLIEKLRKNLRNKTTIGKTIWFYEKNSTPKRYYELGKIIDEASVIATNDPDYKHFIQKVKYGDDGIGYRFCYYALNKNKTKIVFGQFSSHMIESDFIELMKRAQEKDFF